MVTAEFDPLARAGRIVLRPNRSWTWRANACLAGSLMAVSGTMGVAFALQGMWPILPFTVVEAGVVLACLYWCVRRTHLQEVLTFSADHLLFERGIGRPQARRSFQRYFTRFFVRPSGHPWRSKRIALRCRDQELEIGSFLTGAEKDRLIAELRDMIHRLDQPPATTRTSPAASSARTRQ